MSDRTFTQEEVNKIVQDRLAQERNKQPKAGEEDYKAKYEALEKQVADAEQARQAEQADKELTASIMAAFPADKKFTSDYVKNGIIADMKAELAKPESKGKDCAEIFAALTTDKHGIFESVHQAGQMTGFGDTSNFKTNDDAMRQAMGMA